LVLPPVLSFNFVHFERLCTAEWILFLVFFRQDLQDLLDILFWLSGRKPEITIAFGEKD
jgi:hypothetical protein